MLARVFSAAVNGIEAFPVEVEVNSSWGDTVVVIIMAILPICGSGMGDDLYLPGLARMTPRPRIVVRGFD
jgi:hypothetical protein